MAGYSDSIFENLPGSPRRPKPPPVRGLAKELFPVDPRQVVGGLYDLGARGVGKTIDYATGAPSSGEDFSQPTLGREAYQMLTSPTFGGGMSPMAAAPAILAATPLAMRAARAGQEVAPEARTAEEIATGTRAARAASQADAAASAARAAQATPGQAALDQMMQGGQAAARAAPDATLLAQGRANVAGYRTMADVPEIRNMHVDDATQAARGNPHLIEAGNVGTGGFYLGGPRDIKSFDDLQAMRDRFDKRLRENLGGADWYDRYRAGEAQATGNDPTKNLWSSKMHGTWSQGVNPESETQFVLKEATGAIAGQPTRAMYEPQHQAFLNAIEAGDPEMMQLGQKTGEYAAHVNPDYFRINPNAPGATGVNDFRYANEWGYKPYDGTLREGDVALNPAQHRFLDYETALAVDRANKTKLGGRSNWTGEQIQATPWVSQKAAALMRDRPGLSAADAFDEANRTSPDFYDKHAANITTEMQPAPAGVIPGHAPLADQMTPQQRIDYANAVRWGSAPGGRDVIGEGAIPGTGVGVHTLPTEPATGLWEGVTNPMEIGRPLVGFDSSKSLSGDISKTIGDAQKAKTTQPQPPYALWAGDRVVPLGARTGGKDIGAAIQKAAPFEPGQSMTLTGNMKDLGTWEGFDPSGSSTIAGTPAGNKVMTQGGRNILDADAAAKAYFGAQQGVGYHKVWEDPTLGGTNAYVVRLGQPATQEQMTRLQDVGRPYGMGDVTSTHGGMLATGFDPDKPVPQLKPDTRNKLEADLKENFPDTARYPARVDPGIQMPAWGQQGAGTATDWLLNNLGNEQLRSFMNANPGYGRVAGAMAQRDAPAAFGPVIGGQRNDLWNARQVAAADPEYAGQGWADRLQKYQDIIKAGGKLPAKIAVGGAAVSLFPEAGFPAPVPQQQRPPGTSLASQPDWWRQMQDQRWSGF